MPEPDDTVSVKVTELPWIEGLGEEVRLDDVVMVVGLTTWDSEALEFVKLPSVLT